MRDVKASVLRAIVEEIPLAVIVTGLSGAVVAANRVAERLAGTSGCSVDGLLDAAEAYLQARRRGEAGPEVETGIGSRLFRLGGIDAGTHHAWYLCDVTDLVRADEAKRKASRRLAAIIDAAQDAVVEINGEGCEVSPRFWEMLRYPAADAAGGVTCTVDDLCDAFSDPSAFRALVGGTPAGSPVAWIGEALRFGGGTVWLQLRGRRTEHGLLGVFSDVTERMDTEASLRAARDHAEQASRAKSNFLATMSHEIRTPMNTVIGMLDLVMAGHLDRDQMSMVRSAHEGATGLLAILNDILDLSKIEAGRLELEEVPLHPRVLFSRLVDAQRPLAAAKGLDLRLEIEPAVPGTLFADPTRVRQVVSNLVSNAIKFTDAGGVRIVISWDAERQRLVAEVADTGIGMSSSQRERLFEPFTQADGSITRRFGGTGLGLSICRRLVEAMRGSIAVDSEPGRGSTFRVHLPVKAPIEGEFDLGGITALVVCGDAAAAGPLRDVLTTAGVEVAAASSLREMIVTLAQTQPRAVIIDERLQGNGVAAPIIQALAPAASVIVYAERQPAAAPGTLWLRKPLARRDLLELCASLPDVPDVPNGDAAVVAASAGPILVVEDTEVTRAVLDRQMAAMGIAADTAVDGLQALDMLAGGAYRLVMTDLHMPRMDGHALLAEVRLRHPGIPVVAFTADVLSQLRASLLDEGFDDVVTKPATRADLERVLRPLLQGAVAVKTAVTKREPIDPVLLKELYGDDMAEDALARHYGVLARSLRRDLGRLATAMAAESGDRVAAAHTLKGTAAMGAAPALQDAAARLEQALKSGADPRDRWAAVEMRARELLDWLEAKGC